ncbi:MAG TPA: (2Fe-2S) ferredoxin domain-containing protein [Chloroflexia bacterium]|nr:(2Fe-2S) ferredoxin domain-containing protein [Chloroflexia bacterium]
MEQEVQVESQPRKRFLLVCQGLFCMSRGSYGLLGELKKLKQEGTLPEDLEVQAYYCFNGCSHGPNMVCYPEKVWFERVGPGNFSQVLAFLNEGTPATDPGLTQGRVLEVVRKKAYADIEKELSVNS